jgi:hypothetical protein
MIDKRWAQTCFAFSAGAAESVTADRRVSWAGTDGVRSQAPPHLVNAE